LERIRTSHLTLAVRYKAHKRLIGVRTHGRVPAGGVAWR
jgi:hypothetical protein